MHNKMKLHEVMASLAAKAHPPDYEMAIRNQEKANRYQKLMLSDKVFYLRGIVESIDQLIEDVKPGGIHHDAFLSVVEEFRHKFDDGIAPTIDGLFLPYRDRTIKELNNRNSDKFVESLFVIDVRERDGSRGKHKRQGIELRDGKLRVFPNISPDIRSVELNASHCIDVKDHVVVFENDSRHGAGGSEENPLIINEHRPGESGDVAVRLYLFSIRPRSAVRDGVIEVGGRTYTRWKDGSREGMALEASGQAKKRHYLLFGCYSQEERRIWHQQLLGAGARESLKVGSDRWSQYRSIQDAARDARHGDVILLSGGRFVAEGQVVMNQEMSIIGNGFCEEESIIIWKGGKGLPAAALDLSEGGQGVFMSNLVMRGQPIDSNASKGYTAMISDAEESHVVGGMGNTIFAQGFPVSSGTVEKGRFENEPGMENEAEKEGMCNAAALIETETKRRYKLARDEFVARQILSEMRKVRDPSAKLTLHTVRFLTVALSQL